jgi:hypothetical protein
MKTLATLRHEAKVITLKLFIGALIIALLMLSSCQDDNDLTGSDPEDTENFALDAEDDLYNDDSEEIGLALLSSEDLSNGKVKENDPRVACATVTVTGDETAGTIVVDFGEGCTDPRGNERRGKIIVEFEGRWDVPGSFWRLRFEDHFLNDIAVDGVRTVTNITEASDANQRFSVELEEGTLVFPNGDVATRRVDRIRELERDVNNVLKRLIIYGTAEGNNRHGRSYIIEILEPLVYERDCAGEGVIIPVSGVKKVTHGVREITIDYGDGDCDNTVTITNKSGRTWSYDVVG